MEEALKVYLHQLITFYINDMLATIITPYPPYSHFNIDEAIEKGSART